MIDSSFKILPKLKFFPFLINSIDYELREFIGTGMCVNSGKLSDKDN